MYVLLSIKLHNLKKVSPGANNVVIGIVGFLITIIFLIFALLTKNVSILIPCGIFIVSLLVFRNGINTYDKNKNPGP